MLEKTTMLLSRKIRETIEAGFTSEEGAKLVDIYDNGYKVIAKLIAIQDRHRDPSIRVRAKEILDEIDRNNQIGDNFKEAKEFTELHPTAGWRNKKPSTNIGTRAIKPKLIERLRALVEQKKLSEAETIIAHGILSTAAGQQRMPTQDCMEMENLLRIHDNRGYSHNRKLGWIKLDSMPIQRLKDMTTRDDLPDTVKSQASTLLEKIEDNRIEKTFHKVMISFLKKHWFNKHQQRHRIYVAANFSHAVLLACTACDNLSEVQIAPISDQEKSNLIVSLGHAAQTLLRLQGKLLGEEND